MSAKAHSQSFSTIALSGWAQPYDALRPICGDDTLHVDYHDAEHIENVLERLSALPHQPTRCIGWSLGGALLLYAISRKILTPKQLVLLATPMQFVANADFTHGMDTLTFNLFYNNFQQDAPRTAKRLAGLIAHGDHHAPRIMELLPDYPHAHCTKTWLPWLDVLSQQHHHHFEFDDFPPTLILHGVQDRVVAHEQAVALCRAIPNATLHSMHGCGHAPHLHNPKEVIEVINTHFQTHGRAA